jgi:hypothetical protein
MKILAIEFEIKGKKIQDFGPYLTSETKQVIELIEKDVIREIYFDENKNAIIVLECSDKNEAEKVLSNLPLVKNKLIGFNLTELKPYNGFSRLIDNH